MPNPSLKTEKFGRQKKSWAVLFLWMEKNVNGYSRSVQKDKFH